MRAAGGEVTLIDLDDYPMPVYHGDLEASEGMPENGRKLRELFIAHDALLIASPENNQSITALLKNTIDWLSRDIGDGKGANSGLAPYRGKVAGIMNATPGPYGGVRHLFHLRQVLSGLGVHRAAAPGPARPMPRRTRPSTAATARLVRRRAMVSPGARATLAQVARGRRPASLTSSQSCKAPRESW